METGFAFLALVAAHNSTPFWQAQGFVIQNSIGKELAASLASYGSDARFMVKKLPVKTAEKQPAPLL